jgi:ADP-ribose pyrophosphatase
MPGFRVVASKTVAELGFLQVDVRTVESPSGERADRVVVSHPGAVAIVPLIDGEIVLIQQYRAPVGRLVLEIPAGKLDSDDSGLLEAAKRELSEETGFTSDAWTPLTSILTTVGFSDERITILLAEELSSGPTTPDRFEEASAVLHRVPFDHAVEMAVSGEIEDAKTVVGILVANALMDLRTSSNG